MMQMVCGVTPEMEQATAKKYELWDLVEKEGLLDCGDEDIELWAWSLLMDYTIYAYAFFRNPNHPELRLKLYPYQDIILNDSHNRVIFAAANQIGKSIALCIKALVFALHNPGKTVVLVSKTLPQSKDLLRQIKGFLMASVIESDPEAETKMEIYFKHYDIIDEKKVSLPDSRILCVPATEAALGYAADLALEDELGFYDDGEYFHNQILQPRTYTTKGQIMVFSNPNGQQGILWSLWNDPAYHKYKFNFLDCPTNSQEEFDRLSQSLTREQVDSTLLAEFTSPEGGFLTLDERKDMQKARSSMLPSVITTPIYIFFDWAKSRDRTVRIIGVPKHENDKDWADAVWVYEMKEYPQGTDYSEIIDVDLRNLIQEVGVRNVAMVGWDNTGVGRGIEDFVNRVEQLGIQAMPVEFSLQNKSRIYTLFKLLVEQRRITIPYVKECDKQLSMLRFKRTNSRGNLQVHHENEKDRDDFPDAIAGLCSLIIQPENPPVTAVII